MVAYFSMEIGLEAGMPTYSGGLGVLAGDTIRAAADLKVPMVAITLLHRKGYFYQSLDKSGEQHELPVAWDIDDYLTENDARVIVTLEGRLVHLRAWKYEVTGIGGYTVPAYFLDADLEENSEWDRRLTDFLYGYDERYRLCQELILGIGGIRMLRALGYTQIERFHMNEGHSSLLTLELLDEEAEKAGRQTVSRSDIETIRERCVFTTHTPVPTGHDQFPMKLVRQVFGPRDDFLDLGDLYSVDLLRRVTGIDGKFSTMEEVWNSGNALNMTYLALNLSGYVNGVAKKHRDVSRLMFAGYEIDAINNGVHAATWVSGPFRDLFDTHIPGWRQDNFSLRSALGLPKKQVWEAHQQAKKQLLLFVNRETNTGMEVDAMTIGFARRATSYKRPDLLFYDLERLKRIGNQKGPLQVIYAGKAHPKDQPGKDLIKQIFDAMEALKGDLKIVYLENYDIDLAKMMVAGVDVWLNTPLPPLEASGTSGMKAALNGVPSLSILDGWWIEGNIEGVTGWSIGPPSLETDDERDRHSDSESLYDKLENIILPLFYHDRELFINIMLHAIAINGSFFNAQRMMQQYVLNAYFR